MGRNGFTAHDLTTAPQEAVPYLKRARTHFGFLPNLLALMAESPATLKGYRVLDEIFLAGTLSQQECLVVQLTASVENDCQYCITAHSMQARRAGVDEAVIAAVRSSAQVPDARLAALANLVRELIERRGALDEIQVIRFLDTGFSRAQLLEVILGIAVKTISNYTNHLVGAPVDKELRAGVTENSKYSRKISIK